MSCIAGVGGGVMLILNKALKAERIVAIDGCPLNCVAHSLRGAGVKAFEHLELQTLGFRKGSIDVSDEAIQRGVDAVKEIIARRTGFQPV